MLLSGGIVGNARAMSKEDYKHFTRLCERCEEPVLVVYREKDDTAITLDSFPYPIGGWVFVAVGKVHAVGTREIVKHGCLRYRKHYC
jgi:hypothetical protein